MAKWTSRSRSKPPHFQYQSGESLDSYLLQIRCFWLKFIRALIARFMGPPWGPSGADRTHMGPMLAHELCYLGSYHMDTPCFLEFCAECPQITLKVKLNDRHFQYQPRESQDECLVPIWWCQPKSVTGYRAEKQNVQTFWVKMAKMTLIVICWL